jgi:hypothetical protein
VLDLDRPAHRVAYAATASKADSSTGSAEIGRHVRAGGSFCSLTRKEQRPRMNPTMNGHDPSTGRPPLPDWLWAVLIVVAALCYVGALIDLVRIFQWIEL